MCNCHHIVAHLVTCCPGTGIPKGSLTVPFTYLQHGTAALRARELKPRCFPVGSSDNYFTPIEIPRIIDGECASSWNDEHCLVGRILQGREEVGVEISTSENDFIPS